MNKNNFFYYKRISRWLPKLYVNGTDSNDTVTITDSTPAPGFDVNLNAVASGPFNDDTLIINGKFGSDTINLAGLTSASGVISVTISGGGNDDNLTGSALADTFIVNGTGVLAKGLIFTTAAMARMPSRRRLLAPILA